MLDQTHNQTSVQLKMLFNIDYIKRPCGTNQYRLYIHNHDIRQTCQVNLETFWEMNAKFYNNKCIFFMECSTKSYINFNCDPYLQSCLIMEMLQFPNLILNFLLNQVKHENYHMLITYIYRNSNTSPSPIIVD